MLFYSKLCVITCLSKAEETEAAKPVDIQEVVQELTKKPLIPETILEEDEEAEEDEPESEPESHVDVGTKITEVNEESSTDQEKEITGNHNHICLLGQKYSPGAEIGGGSLGAGSSDQIVLNFMHFWGIFKKIVS